VTQADAERLQQATVDQSNCSVWHAERQWRLTASRFGEITKITDRRNIEKLCQTLLGLDQLTTPALAHGRAYEDKALSMLSEVSV
jgi:hypothetical protein